MASYKAVARRVARLEQVYVEWIHGLSDEELDRYIEGIPVDERAALDAMSDEELERLAYGRMPNTNATCSILDVPMAGLV